MEDNAPPMDVMVRKSVMHRISIRPVGSEGLREFQVVIYIYDGYNHRVNLGPKEIFQVKEYIAF